MQQVADTDKTYSLEEYIKLDETGMLRHEFYYGKLFAMPGEKDINNEIALRLVFLLMQFLSERGYQIYAHDIKVKIEGENKYYYPDVFITKEAKTVANKYFKNEPELIVEVVSESSQVNDYVDKYIDYTKIPSLLYYMIVEPETLLITCYSKSEQGEWQTLKFTRLEETINLEHFDISFNLKQVYE